MSKSLVTSKIIDPSKLFWGSEELEELLSIEERKVLTDRELINWLSFIYWGEDLAMAYAKKMQNESKDKARWKKIYEEEFRHKTMIANWFLDRDIVPDDMTWLVEDSIKKIESISSDNPEETSEVIRGVQLFLEESLFATIKYRFESIKDRDLKTILYVIMKDEAKHISHAKKEILELTQEKVGMGEEIKKKINLIFPIHLASGLLSKEKLASVKLLKDSIAMKVIKDGFSEVTGNYPEQILKKFSKIPEYNCVACSPTRPDGLHLQPKRKNELVYDHFTFSPRCEGFDNIAHGGFIGMLLDEISCYAPIMVNKHLPLTKSLSIKYYKPIKIGEEYFVTSEVVKIEGQVYTVEANILKDEKTYASSIATLYIPCRDKAPLILGSMATSPIVAELLYNA